MGKAVGDVVDVSGQELEIIAISKHARERRGSASFNRAIMLRIPNDRFAPTNYSLESRPSLTGAAAGNMLS